MARWIPHRPQHPVFVITAERNDPCRYAILKRQDRVYTAFGVGPAIDVVAQEYNDIALDGIRKKLIQQIGQRRQVSVDVTNRNRGHQSG